MKTRFSCAPALTVLGLATFLLFSSCTTPPSPVPFPEARTSLEQQLSNERILFRQLTIEMSDGVGLSADLYLPPATQHAVPVLLEFLPYRKEEGRPYRYGLYGYFVEQNYAIARVDIRGTGNSAGLLPSYEYSEQELKDAYEVVEWLAAQPWSSDKVGMFGISWGGFNAIQLGMNAPASLGAILAACASDDLFFDDVHYLDGMMHIDHYEINQDLMNAATSAPSFLLDEGTLQQRFDTEPWVLTKLDNPQDGPFWDRGSINTDYSQLEVPALLIGGLYDGYRDSVPRMLEHTKVPVQALIGPWPHRFPHDAVPGPQVEWRDRALRWFDHFLKGINNGVEREPAFTYFVREPHLPGTDLTSAPGSWRTATGWPLESQQVTYHLDQSGALKDEPPAIENSLALPYVASAGLEAGTWWGDLKVDQRPLDENSLVFDSEPLETTTTVVGFPKAHLRVSTDATVANWFVRLSDVSEDGSITLVTGAGLSGAHRRTSGEVSKSPTAIAPGETMDLEIELHFTTWVFEPGHRIRMSISNAQWPMVWPTPEPMTTRLNTGANGSLLHLPLVSDLVSEGAVPAFSTPAQSAPYPIPKMDMPTRNRKPAKHSSPWTQTIDPKTGDSILVWHSDAETAFPWGQRRDQATVQYRVNDALPAEASVEASSSRHYQLSGRNVEWRGEFSLTSDAQAFHYSYTRTLFENEQLLRTRNWKKDVPRGFH